MAELRLDSAWSSVETLDSRLFSGDPRVRLTPRLPFPTKDSFRGMMLSSFGGDCRALQLRGVGRVLALEVASPSGLLCAVGRGMTLG
jgi:hypothetical protein